MEKITVYGLPINPAHLINQLDKPSFCVSYGTRDRLGKQLNQAIDLVAEDGILLVDNGAFSHWKSGGKMDDAYIDGFINWAKNIADRCPQAVVVIPDVIGGSWEQNQKLIEEWDYALSDRSMVMWHLDEPINILIGRLKQGWPWLGIGSSGEYKDVGTEKWHARMREVFAAIDAWERDWAQPNGYVRPRIHLMRAQSQSHLYPVDSSDSTNLAVNHNRQSRKAGECFKSFAKRIDDKIQASAGAAAEYQKLRPVTAGWEMDRWQDQHQMDLMSYKLQLDAERIMAQIDAFQLAA